MDLRKTFFNYLSELAEHDKSVILLVGDLGYSFVEEFAEKHSKQYVNCGIAEQSMLGIAAGMAFGGLKPYVYSGSLFIVHRAYAQLRNDICYNNLNVNLIGSGAAGFLGFTHNLNEFESIDGMLKGLPNISRAYPEDEKGLRRIMKSFYESKSPSFIQL